MRNRLSVAVLIAGAITLLASPVARADEESVTKGVAAAEAWLALVDHGEIVKSWETTATLFRHAVTRGQLTQRISAARSPLGKVVFRKVILTKYETSLPGAPDGEYVIVQFKTVFENKADAVETVTPMKDPDGEWRVSGYFIK